MVQAEVVAGRKQEKNQVQAEVEAGSMYEWSGPGRGQSRQQVTE